MGNKQAVMRNQTVWYALIMAMIAQFAAVANASDGDFVWARAVGGTGGDAGRSIATDSAGNVYTAGTFSGTVDFDPGTEVYNLVSAGDTDIFVSKIDSTGTFVWAKRMGGIYTDYGLDIALDSTGNVYVTGYFEATADFDPGTATCNLTALGMEDIFVSKLDNMGNLLWAKAMGGTSYDSGCAIAVDDAGNVCIAGDFRGTADFDPGTGTYSLTAGPQDVFVLKLDSTGAFVWASQINGASGNAVFDLAMDGMGNLYATGFFDGTSDFDPGTGTFHLTSAGLDDVFVLKLDSTGAFVWAKRIGGAYTDEGLGIALDGAANVYCTGYFRDVVDFDPGTENYSLTAAGYDDIYVLKLDDTGNFVWASAMGGTHYDHGCSIAVDSIGNVYTTGYFQDTADMDPGSSLFNLTSAGNDDVFVSKLDNAGNFVWAKAVGGSYFDDGYAISTDLSNNVCVTGHFGAQVDFDPGLDTYNLTVVGNLDAFTMKLAAPPPNAIAITPSTMGPTNANSIDFTVTFDKPVQGLTDVADVIAGLTGGATSTGVTITGSGSVFHIVVTGISGAGTLTLAINTGSDVRDLSENPLASSVTSAEVVLDPLATELPLAAWPIGTVLLAIGMLLTARRRTRRP